MNQIKSQPAGPEDSTVGKGVIRVLQGRMSGARWATGQTQFPVQQGRAISGRCPGRSAWPGAAHWCVELTWLSQQCSGACLSYTWDVVYSALLGLLDKCLGPTDAKCGIRPAGYGCLPWCSAWHPCWQVWPFPRSVSTGVPLCTPHPDVWPFSSSRVCLLARCAQHDKD